MGGAVRDVGNVVNQVGKFFSQVSSVLRQGVSLLQEVRSGLNSVSQAIQGNRQDNQRADAAVQRAVDDKALERMRQQRAASVRV